MHGLKQKLLSGVIIPLAVGLGATGIGAVLTSDGRAAQIQPGNPCAAAKNPCAPRVAANPCNPCAAAGTYGNKCAIPRLITTALSNPCAAEPPELTPEEAAKAYDCIKDDLLRAYGKSGHPVAGVFRSWAVFSTSAYPAEAHGPRYLMNYANAVAAPEYRKYEDLDEMPLGSIVAKDGFELAYDGKVRIGTLFIMEKKDRGSVPDSGGWNYTLVAANGSIRTDAKLQAFCNGRHMRADDDDFMMFLPDDHRMIKENWPGPRRAIADGKSARLIRIGGK